MAYNFDPEFQDMIDFLPENSIEDPTVSRAAFDQLVADLNANIDTAGLIIEDKTIPGPEGSPEVPVRVYTPENSQGNTPALLFLHGGGFVIGNLNTEHGSAVALAKNLGVVVVSVDYRLAPENPYPAGLEDCYSALLWTHENAKTLNIDTTRIAIIGQSAGGGLAAGVTLLARDRQGPTICFQFLGIPELDDRLNTPSMTSFDDTPFWNKPNAEISWRHYLGRDLEPGSDSVPSYAAPAREEDLSGLPPAYISAMEFDPLRDEDILYGLRLLQAGIPVEIHTFPGTFHGSSLVSTAAISKRQDREMYQVLSKALNLEISREKK